MSRINVANFRHPDGTDDNITLDSSGRVILGQTDTTGVDAEADDLIVSSTAHAGITVRSGSNHNASVYFADQDAVRQGRIEYNHTGNYMRFNTNGTEELRILSGGGITFNGDTAAANALDDYEEGSWTPSMTFGGGSTGLTGNFSGSYTRIGRLVMAQFQLTLTNKGTSTGGLAVNGLPFTIGSNYHNVSGFSYIHRLAMPQTDGQIFIGATGTTMWIRRPGYSTSDAVSLDNGDFNNACALWGGIVYHV